MKKKSRFLTGLLSAVMALSLCAMPAMAEGEETTGTTPTTNASTIDTSKTGSITIHKYVMENTDNTNTPTAEGNQGVPNGAETIKGVGFTIYQVMNATELTAYYAGESTVENVTVDTYVKTVTEDTETKKVVQKNGENVTKYCEEQFTNENGVTTFSNLPVGLYVVMETTKPTAVTAAVEPFLVSIPMTRIATDNANKEWLYDVHVYPKNSTKKGSVTLEKKGATGDKNDENAASLNNVKFDLYWYDDTNKEWKQIKTGLTTSDGKTAVDNLQTGKYKFVETENTNKGYIVDLNETYEFEIDNEGKLKLPESVESTTNTADYTIDGAKITVYNYKPDTDKKVLKRGANADEDSSWIEGTDYNVGDTISYKISVVVPSNIAKLSTFEVTDTPEHLTDKIDTITVKCDTDTLTENTEYTVAADGADGKGFKITFNPTKIAKYAGQTLIITYDATLDDDAVTTSEGNVNTAKLVYTNKINTDGEPDESSKEEIHDQTVVYTFKIDIEKISDQKVDGENEKLQGVKFDLYKKVDKAVTGAVKGSTIGITGDDADAYFVKVAEGLTTDKDGEVSKSGLSKGTYYLVETETKQGYNLLKGPVKVELNIEYEETWTESNKYENGVLTKHDTTVNRKQYFGDDTSKTVGNVKTTIINRKGFDLPVTGGFGTLLFSAIGVLLVVGGVGVLMSTKKKKGNA